MTGFVVTDPRHDGPTTHMSYWVNYLIDHASGLGNISSIKLQHAHATQGKLKNAITKNQPSIILLNGHGSAESICGYGDEELVSSSHSKMMSLFNDRILHSLACQSGKVLGNDLIANGAKAYIGYKKNFKFRSYALSVDESHHDPIADLFFEPAYEVTKTLLSGETTQKAYDESQDKYAINLQKMLAINNPSSLEIAADLYHDFKNHVLLGNTAAQI